MKQLRSSSAAQTVASIDDLLLQILSRLRLKPLFRLKSVSKHWNSLISDLKLHPKPAVGLIVYPTNSDSYFAYEFPFDKSDPPTLLPDHRSKEKVVIDIMHGCNGLLLLAASNTNRQFVINPTTMQRTMLPEPMPPNQKLAMCLAFDPPKSFRYKVVCISGHNLNNHKEYKYDRFQVYSSETGSWRYASMRPFKGFLDVRNGVYWNGALHWISVSPVSNSIYFDPDDKDHQPRVFPTPPTLMSHSNNQHRYIKYFGESCGHLHFVGQAMTTELMVYEMKTDYSEWFVKYRLGHSICGLIRGRFESGWPMGSHRISALFRGERDEDCFMVLWDKRKITRYNIVSGALEILHDFPHWYIKPPVPYFESICSV